MRSVLAIVWLAAAFSTSLVRGDELVLADGGQSAYRIVVADDASPSTRHAARELQTFLEQITGAKLPIVSDREPPGRAGDHPGRQRPPAAARRSRSTSSRWATRAT